MASLTTWPIQQRTVRFTCAVVSAVVGLKQFKKIETFATLNPLWEKIFSAHGCQDVKVTRICWPVDRNTKDFQLYHTYSFKYHSIFSNLFKFSSPSEATSPSRVAGLLTFCQIESAEINPVISSRSGKLIRIEKQDWTSGQKGQQQRCRWSISSLSFVERCLFTGDCG